MLAQYIIFSKIDKTSRLSIRHLQNFDSKVDEQNSRCKWFLFRGLVLVCLLALLAEILAR